MPIQNSCCVTGHRNITNAQIPKIMDLLRHEILLAMQEGFTNFISRICKGRGPSICRDSGGTAFTICYSRIMERDLHIIDIKESSGTPRGTARSKRLAKAILSLLCTALGHHGEQDGGMLVL